MTAESAPLQGAPAMLPYTIATSGGIRSCPDCDTRWAGTPDSTCFICEQPGRSVNGVVYQ